MRKLFAIFLMFFSLSGFAQTLSPQGCDLIARAAASARMETLGTAPQGATKLALEQMLPRASDPGKAWELLDHLLEKYASPKIKTSPEETYVNEYNRCVKAQGDIDKLLPTRV